MFKGQLKVYSFIVLILCLPEIGTVVRGQERVSPTVNLASLAGKSMGEVIQTLGKPKYCMEINVSEVMSKLPPGTPPFDDACQYRIGLDILNICSRRGRAVAFFYVFGNLRKISTKPEEALSRLGIDVRDTKPAQILENSSERPFMKMEPSARGVRSLGDRDVIWSGDFNEKKWKELRVIQNKEDNRCPFIVAILDANT